MRIPVEGAELAGHLTVPDAARGVVVFAHGSGSSRHSPRNRYVASVLQEGGLGTLLFDLLTPAEEAHRANVFDIDLLSRRLVKATEWLQHEPAGAGLPVSYFGASTGAAAALAAERSGQRRGRRSRGGRPDLAMPVLGDVQAPTLLIVGSRDEVVLELNRRAQRQLQCESRLAVVPGATHSLRGAGHPRTGGTARAGLVPRAPRPVRHHDGVTQSLPLPAPVGPRRALGPRLRRPRRRRGVCRVEAAGPQRRARGRRVGSHDHPQPAAVLPRPRPASRGRGPGAGAAAGVPWVATWRGGASGGWPAAPAGPRSPTSSRRPW